MKFKSIIILLLIGGIAFSLASCTKILDREPKNAITDLNYWKTPEDLKLYCNNFYTSLYTPDQNADVQSDNCVPNSPDSWLYNQAVVPESGGGWSYDDWGSIRNANYFLTHYKTVSGSQNEIEQYVGVIHFFRAYEYFQKVKRFGDVPWINKDLNVNDSSFLYKKRTDRQVVIDSILKDLDYAVSHLEKPGQLEVGRIHKYAALQFLARVALYQGT